MGGWHAEGVRGNSGSGFILKLPLGAGNRSLRQVLADGVVKLEHVVVVEAVKDLAAFFAVGDEPPGAEGAELVGDGGFRHSKLGGEIANAELLGGEKGDQPEARRV